VEGARAHRQRSVIHARSFLAPKTFGNDNEASSPAPPPPRFARFASSSGPPPPLSRGRKEKRSRSRDASASEFFAPRQECCCLQIKAKGGGAPKSAVHWSRIFGCGARLALGALAFRRSTAVLASTICRGSIQAALHAMQCAGITCALGLALKRSTSHAGRNAGGADARTARERFARPRAGTAPAPHLRSHPECVPSMGGLFAELSDLAAVSRTIEFALGAFISS